MNYLLVDGLNMFMRAKHVGGRGDSIDMNNFQEVAATLYDLIEVTHFRVSNENDRIEVAAALYDLVESVHCKVSLIKIRNAIV